MTNVNKDGVKAFNKNRYNTNQVKEAKRSEIANGNIAGNMIDVVKCPHYLVQLFAGGLIGALAVFIPMVYIIFHPPEKVMERNWQFGNLRRLRMRFRHSQTQVAKQAVTTMKDKRHSYVRVTGKQRSNTMEPPIDWERDRFPFCIVWTPIPLLTWLFPVIGHMGIGTSTGVIRDFAGPYYVSEDNMAFGRPAVYWRLSQHKALQGESGWDAAVAEASEIYKKRMHNLFCDNCHSHVATALNLMEYNGSTSWNMVKLAFFILIYGKYVSFVTFLKTWAPFSLILGMAVLLYYFV